MKAIIYLRTSTKDQNPELQKDQCIEFCKQRGIESIEIVSEQGSAYKIDKKREKWEYVLKRAKEEKLNIILWKYDRAFRNREEFYKLMKVMFEVHGIKIYSVTEPSILVIWDMFGKTNTGNPIVDEMMNGQLKLMWNFMIQMAGEQAEEESRKKSQRVKLAVRKTDGVTKSYKGNKWGHHSLSKEVDKNIIELSKEGKSYRKICEEVFYWDKSRNKRFVSLGYVHKILKEFSLKDSS